jgi:glycosyltransferase involved in cell wall biosynthesis
MASVTVAIPVRNAGARLDEVLSAVRSQQLSGPGAIQLLVCDSGSTDSSVALARGYGAEVFQIEPSEFSHGGTRNLLMEQAEGDHVAFLTQDSIPADERWLARLLGGFELAEAVALVFGPYLPRPDASPMVARELTVWFESLAPDRTPQTDRLGEHERHVPARALLGRRGYFTDANGCVSKAAWRSVQFREVSYAEDHALAIDMLRAGFAKAYVPDAAVIHSHDYSGWEWLRRSFDEARAIHELYGFDDAGQLRRAALNVWGLVGADLRWARAAEHRSARVPVVARSVAFHTLRAAGTVLGVRARRLPDAVVRRLSLEGRR